MPDYFFKAAFFISMLLCFFFVYECFFLLPFELKTLKIGRSHVLRRKFLFSSSWETLERFFKPSCLGWWGLSWTFFAHLQYDYKCARLIIKCHITHTHTHTNAHTHNLSLFLSLSLPALTQIHSSSLSLFLSLGHALTHTHPFAQEHTREHSLVSYSLFVYSTLFWSDRF